MRPYVGAHRSLPTALLTRNNSLHWPLHGALGSPRFRISRLQKLPHATPIRNSGILASPACQHRWYTANTRSNTAVKQPTYRVASTGLQVATHPHRLELSHPRGAHCRYSTASPDALAQETDPELAPEPNENQLLDHESQANPASNLLHGNKSEDHFPEAFQCWCRSKGIRLRRKFFGQPQLKTQEFDGTPVLCRLSIRGSGIDGEIHTSSQGQNNVVAMQNASLLMVRVLKKKGMWSSQDETTAIQLLSHRKRLHGARILFHCGIIEPSFEDRGVEQGVHTVVATFKVPNRPSLTRDISTSAPSLREAKEKSILTFVKVLMAEPDKYHFPNLVQRITVRHNMRNLQNLLNSPEMEKYSAEWDLTDDDIQDFYNLWDREWLQITFVEQKKYIEVRAALLPKKMGYSSAPNPKDLNFIEAKGHRSNNIRKSWERAILNLINYMKTDVRSQKTWAVLKDLASGTILSMTDKMTQELNLAKMDLHQAREQFPKVTPNFQLQNNLTFRPASKKYERTRSKDLKRILDQRKPTKESELAAKLPVSQVRQEVLDLINKNRYSIFSSKTGSGKSTQIPQIILDDATRRWKGGQTRVLCIQPRRLAAQLLAQRVAEERREPVGDTVGCNTRFDHRPPADGGTITYCTTGIALNMIQLQPKKLESYSHIILDEAHVRDVNIDFLMILLKRHVARCESSGIRAPQVVIMSATIDLEKFTSFFGIEDAYGKFTPAPSLLISGSLHKVKNHYLDDILESLVSKHSAETAETLLSLGRHRTTEYLNRHYDGFDVEPTVEEAGFDSVDPWASHNLGESRLTVIKGLEYDKIVPTGLIAATVLHILSSTASGAILVFLPGIATIDEVELYLRNGAEQLGYDFSNENLFRLIKAHAEFPEEMAKLKDPFPQGCRRILLSTDVAEASVTIPDVKYVVDSGRFNRVVFDAGATSREMVCSWIGKSNAVQRAGRAGRVEPGEYFFLGTKRRYDSLPVSVSPEFIRGDLRTMCLKAKFIDPQSEIGEFLALNIDPPDPDDVVKSIDTLKHLGALDEESQLTPLGSLLARLPVEPAFGKLILLGIIFRCLDPMIILGLHPERLLYKDVSVRARIDMITGFDGARSDHITLLRAFGELRRKMIENGRDEALEFALASDLNFSTFREGLDLGRQIVQQLRALRFDIMKRGPQSGGRFGYDSLNVNSDNYELIKALLAHCLAPNFAKPKSGTLATYETMAGNTPGAPKRFKHQYRAFRRGLVNVYPRKLAMFSGLFQRPPRENSMAGSTAFEGVSYISPLTACLFGGELERDNHNFTLDSWLRVPFKSRDRSVSTDEGANAISSLHETLGLTITDALNSLHPRQNFEVPEECRTFRGKREQLFRGLEKAVLRAVDADDHPLDFFRRGDGTPAPKYTSIPAPAKEDAPSSEETPNQATGSDEAKEN